MAVKAPTKLKTKGKQLWNRTVEVYELRSDELSVLEQACRELDLIDRLQKEVDANPVMTVGSKEQLVVSPAIQEIRQHRSTFQALLKSLKLPDDPGEAGDATANSTRARATAQGRWRRSG